MKIYAISDFHLSNGVNKPMDIFGDNWIGHWDKITDFWQKNITDEDIVLSAGDTSWAMSLEEAIPDLQAIDAFHGTKYIIRGNHDYWWSSYNKINSLGLKTTKFIQNNAFKCGEYIICGTRAWTVPENGEGGEDKKIFDREVIRLKLTLEQGAKLRTDGEKIILMTHYPPFNSKLEKSAFTEIITEYGVDKVIYGHLHGNRSRYVSKVVIDGIEYLLTSCDFLNFEPLRIY